MRDIISNVIEDENNFSCDNYISSSDDHVEKLTKIDDYDSELDDCDDIFVDL